jgi:GNAT superfamily N-acetyltransferase
VIGLYVVPEFTRHGIARRLLRHGRVRDCRGRP